MLLHSDCEIKVLLCIFTKIFFIEKFQHSIQINRSIQPYSCVGWMIVFLVCFNKLLICQINDIFRITTGFILIAVILKQNVIEGIDNAFIHRAVCTLHLIEHNTLVYRFIIFTSDFMVPPFLIEDIRVFIDGRM